MRTVFASVLVLVLFVFTANAFANSSSYYEGDGATIFPIENKNIVMKKEVVRIKPYPNPKDKWEALRWVATCEFFFYNKTNSEQSVTMGYPDWLNNDQIAYGISKENEKLISKYIENDKEAKQILKKYTVASVQGYTMVYFKGYEEGKLPYIKEYWLIRDLKVCIDSKELATEHRPINMGITTEKKIIQSYSIDTDKSFGAFIWKVNFKPNEVKLITVTFNFGGLIEEGVAQELSYILKSGALWADKIGEADIYWDVKGLNLYVDKIYPPDYKIENNIIHWHFENFKPTKDISIFVEHEQ